MAITRNERSVPSGGSEFLSSIALETEQIEGWTGANLPKSPAGFAHGYQSIGRKVAKQISATGSLYPDDGTGTTAASAASGQANITLASNVLQTHDATLDPVGYLLAGRYATAPDLWEVVRIISWNGGTQVATVNRNLTNTWGSGTKYHLLFDIRLAETVHILSEFSASGTTGSVELVLFDWATNTAGTAGPLIRTFDLETGLANTAVQGAAGEIQETSYYYGRIRSRPVRGLMGCKVRMKSVANGSISLWLARS